MPSAAAGQAMHFDSHRAPPQVIVFERGSKWIAAIRDGLGNCVVGTFACRSYAECSQWLTACEESVVCLEADVASAGRVLQYLAELERLFPKSIPVVLLERQALTWEMAFREASAVCCVTSTRSTKALVELIDRYARRFTAAAQSYTEQILADLPLE